jgi:sugar/nucleoside kinase (ribokinase family)
MIITVGSANTDLVGQIQGEIVYGTSNPGIIHQTFGGVGFNMVRNLALLNEPGVTIPNSSGGCSNHQLSFIGIFGDDSPGKAMVHWLEAHGVHTGGSRILQDEQTSRYMEILDSKGELVLGLSHMAIAELLNDQWLSSQQNLLQSADWILAECNLPIEALEYLGRTKASAKLMIEGVSQPKVVKIRNMVQQIDLLKVNYLEGLGLLNELRAMAVSNNEQSVLAEGKSVSVYSQQDIVEHGLTVAQELIRYGMGAILVTMGKAGAWYLSSVEKASEKANKANKATDQVFIPAFDWNDPAFIQAMKSYPNDFIADSNATTTGAGDSFSAGFLWALGSGSDPRSAGRSAAKVAALTCLSNLPVHPRLPMLMALLQSGNLKDV